MTQYIRSKIESVVCFLKIPTARESNMTLPMRLQNILTKSPMRLAVLTLNRSVVGLGSRFVF